MEQTEGLEERLQGLYTGLDLSSTVYHTETGKAFLKELEEAMQDPDPRVLQIANHVIDKLQARQMTELFARIVLYNSQGSKNPGFIDQSLKFGSDATQKEIRKTLEKKDNNRQYFD